MGRSILIHKNLGFEFHPGLDFSNKSSDLGVNQEFWDRPGRHPTSSRNFQKFNVVVEICL
jgi:hypothetical protein